MGIQAPSGSLNSTNLWVRETIYQPEKNCREAPTPRIEREEGKREGIQINMNIHIKRRIPKYIHGLGAFFSLNREPKEHVGAEGTPQGRELNF